MSREREIIQSAVDILLKSLDGNELKLFFAAEARIKEIMQKDIESMWGNWHHKYTEIVKEIEAEKIPKLGAILGLIITSAGINILVQEGYENKDINMVVEATIESLNNVLSGKKTN